MSISLMRSECRKFAPNIFNKSKCTNCFRQKEEHSAEALESNRATRKVAKCGYLFVAPGWDFANPLNRTKRWQRRWFVLYDDGELSYSVDEHPETVPQASIDMNKVLEVSDAEAVTGNAFSLAITAPDTVTFVKGTCREECRWWADVLAVFPRSKGRQKRTVALPGGQIPIIQQKQQQNLQQQTSQAQQQQQQHLGHQQQKKHQLQQQQQSQPSSLRVSSSVGDVRPRFWLDAVTEARTGTDAVADGDDDEDDPDEDDDVFPTRDVVDAPAVDTRKVYRDQPASSGSPPTRDKIASDDKSRTRRVQNREKRGLKTGRSFSEDFASILPSWRETKRDEKEEAARRVLFHEYANECKRDEKLKDIAASLTRPVSRDACRALDRLDRVLPTRDCGQGKQVRGDPDGCGLDVSSQRYSPSSELRVDLPAEDLLNIKKGWLMKQGSNKEWNKHWFVLRGAALMFYRDPTSEDKGLLDGVIDLSGISNVSEVQVARNYGFQMMCWDERRYVLSAVTAGIRSNWMAAVRRAAGLQELSPKDITLTIGEKLERELDNSHHRTVVCPLVPSTPRSMLFSSDDEYRTASESGPGGPSDWGETVALSLPPSPPLNRTPISRVKERARSRVCKRSRSSPPDSLACCGEMPESDVDERLSAEPVALSALQETAERQKRELEDMKSQLKLALCEMSSAEKEVVRLREREAEAGALERQVQELLASLRRTEEQLEQRTREAAELDALKERYTALLHDHDQLLAQQDWRALYQQLQERFHHDKEVWEQQLSHSEADLQDTAERCKALTRELEAAKSTSEDLRQRLADGLEENEGLYARLHELELELQSRNPTLSSTRGSRERGRSMDSLSDLTNIDLDLDFVELDKERLIEEFEELRGRFEKAVAEIRAMKRELRESHALYDELELVTLALRQDARRREEADRAQAGLMAARIEDLTLKLSAAEKQVRLLKQKLSKSESREKRRSLSLKGRESFQICRELEDKLAELECKLAALESGSAGPVGAIPSSPSSPSPTPSLTGSTKSSRERRREASSDSSKKDTGKVSARLRRKSLDSATSSEPMKVLIRLSALESKVAKAVAERGVAGVQATEHQVRVSVERVLEERDPAVDSELHSRLAHLEDVVCKSRSKMRECMRLIAKSTSPTSPTRKQQHQEVFAVLERSLGELEAILQSCSVEEVTSEVKSVVIRLERLLQSKLKELFRQRQALRQAGQLDRQAKLALVAEKLAYETVLMGRIQQADSRLSAEVHEVNRLMSGLVVKLSGEAPSESVDLGVQTSVEHLTRVMSRYLELHGRLAESCSGVACRKEASSRCGTVPHDTLDALLKRKQELDATVATFRAEKLGRLAQCFAMETLNWDSCRERERGSQNAGRIREAWKVAQEAVNHELVQAEISHVMMRCAQSYESVLTRERAASLSLARLGLELWADAAEDALRTNMEDGVSHLTALYEERLADLKRCGPKRAAHVDEEEVRQLLAEFADVTAHKVLVDSRIAVLRGDVSLNCESGSETGVNNAGVVDVGLLSDTEATLSRLLGDNTDLVSSAEFDYLFHKFCGECRMSLGDGIREVSEEEPCSGEVMWALSDIKEELNRLQDCIQVGAEDGPRSAERSDRSTDGCWSWTDICAQCTQLRQQVVSLQSCVLQSQACQRCQQLQGQLQKLESLHDEEMRQLRQSQEKEMAELSGELEMQRRSLVCQHELEQAQLKERARKLERRLDTLDSEYSLQMDNLRTAYQKTLAAGLERDLDSGDNIRQRYQAEIEHLRALCEKGLVAMDNSHRRIIAELEEKHRQEAEQLRLEKDQALAEETQATLAALDAMRKAHEMEVQKEIAKFKAEFIKKMQATHDIGALHKEHEAEMEEIKQEILSLSEKYSVKCLESASLEEQLGLVSNQLAQAQQHILDLDARNKQLRAHLVSEVNEESSSNPQLHLLRESKLASSSPSSGSGSSTVSVSSASVRGGSSSSGSSVDSMHGSAGRMDCWPQQTTPQASGVLDPWGLRTKGSKRSDSSNGLRPDSVCIRTKSNQRMEPAVLASAELMRYPRRHCSSLPPLGSPLRSSSPSLSSLSSHSSSPCPLSGMVAERKKLFEQ